MKKYIHRISGCIPNTNKAVDINIDGRNLIITGGNGSGKTCLLTELNNKVKLLIADKKQADLESIERQYRHKKDHLLKLQKGTTDYDNMKSWMDSIKKELDSIKLGLTIDIPNNIDFSSKFDDRAAVISFFKAERKSDITAANTAKGIDSEKQFIKDNLNNKVLGNNLEQHLVNLRNRRSLAITEDDDHELAKKIFDWFSHFEKDLQLLLEDETASLKFKSDTLKFTILQQDKPEYTFQSLSSGYKAIFDIYADLLMRTEYYDVTPKDLVGTVFIDEIDAHLHVSLQRLILPFFTQSFPKIQFIVTTHSPFVLMSVEDAVIYDLSKNEQIDDNISMYSHTSIIEGLLGTKPTSQILDKYINELAEVINSDSINYPQLEILLDKLRGSVSTLDSKSKSFFMLGENALLDKDQ